MTQQSDDHSIFVLSRGGLELLSEKVSDGENPNEHRAGRWTEPKYICAKIENCRHKEHCRHSKPHKQTHHCHLAWVARGGVAQDSQPQPPMTVRTAFYHDLDVALNMLRSQGQLSTHIPLHDITLDTYAWDVSAAYERFAWRCSHCLAIPDSRRFIPLKRPKLQHDQREVVCPASVTSCIGRCPHAEPHTHNKFCKDLFHTNEIRLHCRPLSARRQLLFDGYNLSCQHGER